MVPLVVGKISVPPRRAGTVPRPRLTDALGEDTPLVAVVAPAGCGKTTLLTDWAHSLGSSAVGWLTLDDADDEPSRFWTYLVSAVRAADDTLGAAALAALRVPGVDPLEAAVPTSSTTSRRAVLRAVENGMSLVRPARQGTSLAVDHQGRVLGQDASWYRSDAATTDHTMTVAVPTRGARTPYALVVGDVLGRLSIAGILWATTVVVLRRRRARATAPAGEPKPRNADVLTAN